MGALACLLRSLGHIQRGTGAAGRAGWAGWARRGSGGERADPLGAGPARGAGGGRAAARRRGAARRRRRGRARRAARRHHRRCPPFDVAAMDGWAVAGPGPWTVVGELLAGPGARPPRRRRRRRDRHRARRCPRAPTPCSAASTDCSRTTACTASQLLGRRPGARAHRAAPGLRRARQRHPSARRRVRGGRAPARGRRRRHPRGRRAWPRPRATTRSRSCARPTSRSSCSATSCSQRGPARDGRVRDALGPMVPGWIAWLGGRAFPPVHVPDTLEALLDALEDANADVVVTTGSTAAGPADHLHAALNRLGAHWVVDGVAVRPGTPMLLATLPDGRHVLGAPRQPARGGLRDPHPRRAARRRAARRGRRRRGAHRAGRARGRRHAAPRPRPAAPRGASSARRRRRGDAPPSTPARRCSAGSPWPTASP